MVSKNYYLSSEDAYKVKDVHLGRISFTCPDLQDFALYEIKGAAVMRNDSHIRIFGGRLKIGRVKSKLEKKFKIKLEEFSK